MKITSNKKPRTNAGAEICWRPLRSITSDDWAAELVVQTDCDHVHVLADRIYRCSATGRARERVVGTAHEETVVFDTGRPIRREAIFETNADGGAPFMRGRIILANTGCGVVIQIVVVRQRRTAL